MPKTDPPAVQFENKDTPTIVATGSWQVNTLAHAGALRKINDVLDRLSNHSGLRWDLSAISALDHTGAQLLWNAWGKKRPAQLVVPEHYQEFFNRIEQAGPLALPQRKERSWPTLAKLGVGWNNRIDHVVDFIALLGQVVTDLGRLCLQPQRGPWKEISANIFHTGYRALGITALVGCLIGIVLSYLSAQQLQTFGADIYLVNILGMSIVRELGPLLAAILVAGRSGSSITAQLGVMRVNEELDAMLVMGLPHGFRLIMPKVLALSIVMPLLVVWTSTMALIGGMVAANIELGLSPVYFVQKLPDVVPIANYWIGLGKGVVFGALIALVACHFGLRIEANTESLGRGTTGSVVTAITIVILADAVFAIIFNGVGY